MIQRAKHHNLKKLRYLNWAEVQLQAQLKKSFLKNFFLLPKLRLSFIFQKRFYTSAQQFYGSQNKLQCVYSNSFSVPSKKLQNSRFYLNKALDRLMHGGYQKYNGLLFFTAVRAYKCKYVLRVRYFTWTRAVIIFKSFFNLSIFNSFIFNKTSPFIFKNLTK